MIDNKSISKDCIHIKFEPLFNNIENLNNFDMNSTFSIPFENSISKSFDVNPFLNLPPLNNIFAPNPLEILSNIDWNLEEDSIIDEKCNHIFNIINKNNSSLLKSLETFNIPHNVSKLLFKQLIKLTIKEVNKS
ncbi:hypothetical protein [Clostridium fallax]|uniref:Uncharacterized protein n=1 Tax=Clostridium fallax TaxID=1533 RepID=A0A1M4VUZ5_9CLOT|nr:hypothetical protein [Clostridium fallax]SHE72582.1 hypothetical protein SAMN05443638_10927 [Clostridium fallax]SQB07699.1 Uncharacterised protein [Clostridium fallax]